MAFDIYVGSLTRFFTDGWENVVQRKAREQGQHYQKISPGGPRQPQKPEEIRPLIESWRDAINRALGQHLSQLLNWDEPDRSPYFTDRPGWGGYGAVLLAAAYDDQPGKNRPEFLPEDFFSDSALQESLKDEFQSRYPVLLRAQVWLPADFKFMFKFPALAGKGEDVIGSVAELIQDLKTLSSRVLEKALPNPKYPGDQHSNPDLLSLARIGHEMWLRLATEASSHHLPMRFSY